LSRRDAFLAESFRIRFHSGGKRQRKKGFSIVGNFVFWALPGKFAGREPRASRKWLMPPRIGAAVIPRRNFFFIQEKIAGQYALAG